MRFRDAEAAHQLRHHDVFKRREFRQQMVELVDEADVVAADRGAFVVGEPPARPARQDDVAGIRLLEQAGGVQQCRFAGARRRHQRDHLAALQRKVGAVQDGQLARSLNVVAFDAFEFDDYVGHGHSYLSASTGSSFAARQAGNRVARNDSTSAIRITEKVSRKSMIAGSWLRK